ncbi:MAG: VTT domain-containing protein [Pseudomonadota bacterium]|nr:VTT domain-containing protein [Pseudomonadota bacterium]
MSRKIILRTLILFTSLVALGVILKTTGLGAVFDKSWIDAQVKDQGASGKTLFVAAAGVLTAVGLPRQVVAFFAGYAFGLIPGILLSVLAATIGCATAFSYARFLGRDLVQARFPNRARKIDDFLSENPFTMTLLIRFLPVGSNLVVNLAAGVSSVGALSFIVASSLGYIPQMIVFALVGTGITVDPALRIGCGVALFAVSGAFGIHLYRKYRHGKTFDDRIDCQLGEGD